MTDEAYKEAYQEDRLNTELSKNPWRPRREPIVIRRPNGDLCYAMGALYTQIDGYEAAHSLDRVPYCTWVVSYHASTAEELEDTGELQVMQRFTENLLPLLNSPDFRYIEWRIRPILITDPGAEITKVRARFVLHTTQGVIAPSTELSEDIRDR